MKPGVFLNPRLSREKQQSIQAIIAKISEEKLQDHFWLMSSGTESARLGQQKMIALSQEALRASAQGVVETFALTASDIYLKSLPSFHIGGLSIVARAEIAGFKVLDLPDLSWSAKNFVDLVEKEKITVASLVPTQIFDLLQGNLKAPTSLRLIFVGGGSLSQSHFDKAKNLGWPLVLTYGMTETCAMLAFTHQWGEGAKRLPHITDWQADGDGRLAFLSPALLSAYLFIQDSGAYEVVDPKIRGWYRSDDCGEIVNDRLFLKGRESELVKIAGETVSLLEMQNAWECHLHQQELSHLKTVIVALPEERRGFQLVVAVTTPLPEGVLESFNQSVLPFRRLQRVAQVTEFPTSPLGKILRAPLAQRISNPKN